MAANERIMALEKDVAYLKDLCKEYGIKIDENAVKIEAIEKKEIETKASLDRILEILEEQKAYRAKREEAEKLAAENAKQNKWRTQDLLVAGIGILFAAVEVYDKFFPKGQ